MIGPCQFLTHFLWTRSDLNEIFSSCFLQLDSHTLQKSRQSTIPNSPKPAHMKFSPFQNERATLCSSYVEDYKSMCECVKWWRPVCKNTTHILTFINTVQCWWRVIICYWIVMGRNASLTDIEKGKILALRAHNVSANKIAMEVHRSKNVVQNFLRQLELYGTKRSTGRPSFLTSRDRRHVLRAASNQCTSVGQIKARLHLPHSKTTIWRAIHFSGIIKHRKMRKTPMLQGRHKMARLQWARETMTWSL